MFACRAPPEPTGRAHTALPIPSWIIEKVPGQGRDKRKEGKEGIEEEGVISGREGWRQRDHGRRYL